MVGLCVIEVFEDSSQEIWAQRSIRIAGKQGSKPVISTEKAACRDACFSRTIQHLGEAPERDFLAKKTGLFEMVNVGPIQATGHMQPIAATKLDGVNPSKTISNSIPVDRVEISQIARLMSEATLLPEVQAEKIAQVKAQIEAGTYITPEKMDTAVERLLQDLQI